jgi:uncharacterized peroxidase-related enzyme
MMRLKCLRSGLPFTGRLKLRLAPLLTGAKAPELMNVLFYRPRFFGKPFSSLMQELMRVGPSDWSVPERELFAAYVSAKNACRFCVSAHTAIASRQLGDLAHKAIDGDPPASLGKSVITMLPFLEKLTAAPSTVTADDINTLRREGITDEAILDAAYICMAVCGLNRVVDALGCEPMAPLQLERVTRFLHEKGYLI